MDSSSIYQSQSPRDPQCLNEVFAAIKEKLYQSIVAITSDEALKQLSFSPELSEFKYGRIREILAETFNLSPLLQEMALEVAKSEAMCRNLQVELQEKNREQLNALQQVQKKFSEYKYTLEMERVSTQSFSDPSRSYNQKQQRLELQRTIEQQGEQIQNYKMMMRSMQEDMLRIKNEWERRCRDIEVESEQHTRCLVEEVRREAQGKLDMWLSEIERENGQIVVREDKQLLEYTKGEHQREMKRIKESHERIVEELEERIEQSRVNERREKEENQHYIQKLKSLKAENESREENARKENGMLKSQIDSMVSKSEEMMRERQQGEKRLAAEAEGLAAKFSNASQVVESKQHEISILKERVQNYQNVVKELKQVKYRLTVDVSEKDSKSIELQGKLIKALEREKMGRNRIENITLKLKGLQLACIRLKSHQKIQKDQIKSQLQSFKRRITSLQEQVSRNFYMQLQKCEMRYTGKLNSLIDQFDVNQKNENATLEQALRDNQGLRMQLKDYEDAFEEKMEEFRREKQAVRAHTEEEVEKLKRNVMKMVRAVGSQKGEVFGRVKEELQMRDREISRMEEEVQESGDYNQQLKRKIQSLQGQIQECQKEKKSAQKELREARAQLMVKNTMVEEYSKPNKQKQNVRNNNRRDKEKEMEEIRLMLAKSYQVVGSEPPERHRRKH